MKITELLKTKSLQDRFLSTIMALVEDNYILAVYINDCMNFNHIKDISVFALIDIDVYVKPPMKNIFMKYNHDLDKRLLAEKRAKEVIRYVLIHHYCFLATTEYYGDKFKNEYHDLIKILDWVFEWYVDYFVDKGIEISSLNSYDRNDVEFWGKHRTGDIKFNAENEDNFHHEQYWIKHNKEISIGAAMEMGYDLVATEYSRDILYGILYGSKTVQKIVNEMDDKNIKEKLINFYMNKKKQNLLNSQYLKRSVDITEQIFNDL